MPSKKVNAAWAGDSARQADVQRADAIRQEGRDGGQRQHGGAGGGGADQVNALHEVRRSRRHLRRPQARAADGFCAAYFRDLDGNKLAAFCA